MFSLVMMVHHHKRAFGVLQDAIFQGYLGARQYCDQITTILHHHHLITTILPCKMVVILDQGQMC
jgi:hypothetical protein